MPVLTAPLVALVLLIAPPDHGDHDFGAEGLDSVAVEVGLRARVGDAIDRWEIDVQRHAGGHYELELRGPGQLRSERRTVELSGESIEDRSRELASTLALIIEAETRGEPTGPGDGPGEGGGGLQLPVGFMALEGHVALGPPAELDPGLGLGLGGGAWLYGDHLQPRARVRWSHGWSGEIRAHQLSVGLGLAAGAPVGRLWFGALVMPAFEWTHARQARSDTAWSGGGEICVLAQYRRQHLVLGVRTGVETTFPALRAIGTRDELRWGHLRWLLVFELGLGI